MIVVLHPNASASQTEAVIGHLSRLGFDVHKSSGEAQTALGALGVQPGFDVRQVLRLPGVAQVHRVTQAYRFASKAWKPDATVVPVGDARIGDGSLVLGARLDTATDLLTAAHAAAAAGATFGFGGPRAARPTQAPEPIADYLSRMGAVTEAAGLALAVAVGTPSEADAAAHRADLLVANAHRMTDTDLLQHLGTLRTPVLLYRGANATVEEWLVAADYVLAGGNEQVVLCEGGLRLFGSPTRTLDVSSVAAVQAYSHLPLLADATYGTGKPEQTASLTRAAVAAGAAGAMLDTFADDLAPLAGRLRAIADIVASGQATSRRVTPRTVSPTRTK